MKNQKGEVVTAVTVIMMAVMMVLGMARMHGGHGDHKDHVPSKERNHSDAGHQHMSHDHADKAVVSDIDAEEKK